MGLYSSRGRPTKARNYTESDTDLRDCRAERDREGSNLHERRDAVLTSTRAFTWL